MPAQWLPLLRGSYILPFSCYILNQREDGVSTFSKKMNDDILRFRKKLLKAFRLDVH